ncbi:DUF6465 family protein [Lachnospiraceae bacterium ZAX-1]
MGKESIKLPIETATSNSSATSTERATEKPSTRSIALKESATVEPAKETAKLTSTLSAKTASAKETEKETTKKPATKKSAKKPAAKSIATGQEVDVYVEYNGMQLRTKDILENVKKTYIDEKPTRRPSSIKSIQVYVKPEEGKAYYVINGKGGEDHYIEL